MGAGPPAARDAIDIDEKGKALVRLLQGDIPVVERPFAVAAAEAGMSEEEAVRRIDGWRKAGVIRRFGAVVRHQQLGFAANGMAVFRVDGGAVDEAGKVAAGRREVSHCYRRPSLPGFPYELFAMIHGQSEGEVRAVAAEIAQKAGVREYDVLFSTREYKKVSMEYFMDG
jgi:DNA-binding Lrp family transcriptional regulator